MHFLSEPTVDDQYRAVPGRSQLVEALPQCGARYFEFLQVPYCTSIHSIQSVLVPIDVHYLYP